MRRTLTWIVAFQETGRPTVTQEPGGKNLISSGRIWIDAKTGAVWRVEWFYRPETDDLPDNIKPGLRVEYAPLAGGPNSLAATKSGMLATATLTLAGGLPTGGRVRWAWWWWTRQHPRRRRLARRSCISSTPTGSSQIGMLGRSMCTSMVCCE